MQTFSLFIAAKHIRSRKLQSLLTILGVAVGVMVLVIALSLTNGFIAELLKTTLRATPHISLLSAEPFKPDAELAAKLATHEQVLAVAPFISTEALITRRANRQLGISGSQGYTRIYGIDPGLEPKVLNNLSVLARKAQDLIDKDGIVLGASLQNQLGVYNEDTVLIQNFSSKRRAFNVAGSFRVGNELIDSVASFTSIPGLQEFMGIKGKISGYHIRIKDPEQATEIGLQLAQQSGLFAQSWQSIFRGLIDTLHMQKALIAVVVFLIIIVASIGIANILILTVAEKTNEIAILRAMGATQQQIINIFTLEGALLGVSGTMLGIILGLLVSLYFKFKPFPLPGELYFITQLPVQIQAADFFKVSALSIFTSILAGLIPAKRAASLNPIDILR